MLNSASSAAANGWRLFLSRGCTTRFWLRQQFFYALKNLQKHLLGKLAGQGVLHRGMIGSQQKLSIGQLIEQVVPELVRAFPLDLAASPQVIQVSVEGDAPQRDHNLHTS